METTLAIVFADIAGSTRIYETLGDAKAREAIGDGLAALARVTDRLGGRVVKTIGDEGNGPSWGSAVDRSYGS